MNETFYIVDGVVEEVLEVKPHLYFPEGITGISRGLFAGYDEEDEDNIYAEIKSIDIPGSVETFEDISLSSCVNLETVSIGKGTKVIGERAFHGCKKIKRVDLPETITTIEKRAFTECTMDTFICPPNLISIGEKAFVSTRITSLHLCGRAFHIGEGAFMYSSLKTLMITAEDIFIPDRCFHACIYLQNAVIREGVLSIGDEAFSHCDALTTITIPNSVNHIGSIAFYNCESLVSVTYNGTKAQWNAITKGENVFWYANQNCVIHCTDGDIPADVTYQKV